MVSKAKRNRLIIGIILFVSLAISLTASSGGFSSRNTSLTKQAQLNEESPRNWVLVIDGLVERPLNLSVSDLLLMPSTSIDAGLYCVGAGTTYAVENGRWEGVALKSILEEAGISENAIKVAFYAPDGFSTDLTVHDAQRNDVIVAYKKDGKFLGDKDINPDLRLVVPGKWGYKWIRTLNHIKLVDYDFKGYYESMGYSDEANIEP